MITHIRTTILSVWIHNDKHFNHAESCTSGSLAAFSCKWNFSIYGDSLLVLSRCHDERPQFRHLNAKLKSLSFGLHSAGALSIYPWTCYRIPMEIRHVKKSRISYSFVRFLTNITFNLLNMKPLFLPYDHPSRVHRKFSVCPKVFPISLWNNRQ